MYPACNSSSTRSPHSLPPGFTPMLTAAPRTSTYGAGCPKICLRMCFNIPRDFSLIFRTPASTTASVRSPETLPYPAGALCPLRLLFGLLRRFSQLAHDSRHLLSELSSPQGSMEHRTD